jgi:hypothetical protein
MKMPDHLSQKAFAKVAGIAQSRVAGLIAEGLPVGDDGKIDPEAGKQWIEERLDPARREVAKPGKLSVLGRHRALRRE